MKDPIQALDRIDVLGRRKDGGADLVIIVSTFLDDVPEHEYLLKRKIQNYVDTIFSNEFQNEFGKIDDNQYTIVIKCSIEPHPNIITLIQGISQYLHEHRLNLIIET